MKKKNQGNQSDNNPPLKLAEPEPKKIRLEDVKGLENFHLKKELYQKELKIIELERGLEKLKFDNAQLAFQLFQHSQTGRENSTKGRLESERRAYQDFVNNLKASYNVKELAYCPDTLELKGD